jgi:hypothetical protein
VRGVQYPSVAAISPLRRHEHSGQPCHCVHVPFEGHSETRRCWLYTALSNREATREAVVYVSLIHFEVDSNCNLVA